MGNPSEALRSFMNRTGRNQLTLAKFLGVSQPTVSKWLKSKAVPPLRTAIRIERLTGVPAASWDGPLREYLRGKGAA